MLWSETVKLSLTSFLLHHILCRTTGMRDEGEWSMSKIYGWPDVAHRDQTWQLLGALKNSVMDAWLCCGNFNEIMWNAEKKGGRLKSSSSMNMFRDVFKTCNLRDLGFTDQIKSTQYKSCGFRLKHMRLQHQDIGKMVQNTWEGITTAENLMQKRQICGNRLRSWAKKEFGSLNNKKKDLYQRLAELQHL